MILWVFAPSQTFWPLLLENFLNNLISFQFFFYENLFTLYLAYKKTLCKVSSTYLYSAWRNDGFSNIYFVSKPNGFCFNLWKTKPNFFTFWNICGQLNYWNVNLTKIQYFGIQKLVISCNQDYVPPTRDVTFGFQLGQISTKLDKSGTFLKGQLS